METSSQQQRQEANLRVFKALSSSLEEEAALREKIRDSVREFDSNVRSLTAQSVRKPCCRPMSPSTETVCAHACSLNSIHAVSSAQFPDLATSGAERLLPACQSNVASLAALVPTDQYYRVCLSPLHTSSVADVAADPPRG